MKVLEVNNVNEALHLGVSMLAEHGEKIAPRGKETLEMPVPIATVYRYPKQRVLFSKIRDANPFFHFMEALWILEGRKDVGFVSKFNSNIKTFSDNGSDFHGAYGYRLRNKFGIDQLDAAINLLKKDKTTRRCVLQMWHCEFDLGAESNDIPCNDLIFLKIRNGALHMRVCCRSNDVIWGAYGANAVHFSMLLEYLAGRVGVEVGTYTQISDSYHVYLDNPKLQPLIKECPFGGRNLYARGCETYPMVTVPKKFDEDLNTFFEGFVSENSFSNKFFPDVAVPMLATWELHKSNRRGLAYVNQIKAEDWRIACREWLERREK